MNRVEKKTTSVRPSVTRSEKLLPRRRLSQAAEEDDDEVTAVVRHARHEVFARSGNATWQSPSASTEHNDSERLETCSTDVILLPSGFRARVCSAWRVGGVGDARMDGDAGRSGAHLVGMEADIVCADMADDIVWRQSPEWKDSRCAGVCVQD